MSFLFRADLRGELTDEFCVQSGTAKQGLNPRQGGSFLCKLHVDDIVIGIDFVAEPGHAFHFQGKPHHLFRVSDASCVDLQFDHVIMLCPEAIKIKMIRTA